MQRANSREITKREGGVEHLRAAELRVPPPVALRGQPFNPEPKLISFISSQHSISRSLIRSRGGGALPLDSVLFERNGLHAAMTSRQSSSISSPRQEQQTRRGSGGYSGPSVVESKNSMPINQNSIFRPPMVGTSMTPRTISPAFLPAEKRSPAGYRKIEKLGTGNSPSTMGNFSILARKVLLFYGQLLWFRWLRCGVAGRTHI
jgi:hypothetical protein